MSEIKSNKNKNKNEQDFNNTLMDYISNLNFNDENLQNKEVGNENKSSQNNNNNNKQSKNKNKPNAPYIHPSYDINK